jgi:hypothetical protein
MPETKGKAGLMVKKGTANNHKEKNQHDEKEEMKRNKTRRKIYP